LERKVELKEEIIKSKKRIPGIMQEPKKIAFESTKNCTNRNISKETVSNLKSQDHLSHPDNGPGNLSRISSLL